MQLGVPPMNGGHVDWARRISMQLPCGRPLGADEIGRASEPIRAGPPRKQGRPGVFEGPCETFKEF
jgi:hypothetical protein